MSAAVYEEERHERLQAAQPSEAPSDLASEEKWGRIKYAGFLLVTFVLGLIVRSGKVALPFKVFPPLEHLCDDEADCLGVSAVYRLSFALFVFYLLLMLVASPLSCCLTQGARRTVVTRSWHPASGEEARGAARVPAVCDCCLCIKVLLYLVLIVASFFIPAEFFQGYAYVAAVCGVIFLIMQCIIIIDFAYNWNEAWAARAEEEPAFLRASVCATATCTVIGIVLTGLMYHWFVTPSGCGGGDKSRHAFFISFNLICAVFYTLATGRLAVIGHKQASLLPSSVIFLYCTWQVLAAMLSYSGDGSCNDLQERKGGVTAFSVIAVIVAAIALVYAAVSAGFSRDAFTRQELGEQATYSFTFFFICMMMGAGYLAMVLTGWDVSGTGIQSKEGELSVDGGKTSMWAKIGVSWLTILLYVMSLLAPVCCPQRFADSPALAV
eukprot:TRINITY_DN65476_c0_g1_i1.p1 TRINITY_DN65476_c0_g1~~TRINITY_DN65476_c0_g1_i1.p1  ORF type:complete len:459 (+),score=183.48 TRINITY_DN65476_c0_g1_i1:66-1379(+)